MSATAQQKFLVREGLFKFISKHAPRADLTVIDDVILVYVISFLQEASKDPCFDVDGFVEMLAAYVPEFAHIDLGMICAWVLDLEAELRASAEETKSAFSSDDSTDEKVNLALQSLSEMLPTQNTAKINRSHSNSESSECAESNRRPLLSESDEHADQCSLLHEMFPNSCVMEIKHCVSIAHGDVERAAATLLHRREQGQSLSAAALHNAIRPPVIDDNELKTRIIERYSYVDKSSETKEHKPLAPKIEPKKMVRYRDNKIVSLKGERYTEVPKSGIDEEQLKKPKKQHCP